jgi:hypothetical protein
MLCPTEPLICSAALPPGYLLEIYEVSRLYRLPDMEFVIHVGDMVSDCDAA